MALTAPFAGEPVTGTWTDGVTALVNGLLQSTTAQATSAITGLTTEQDVPGCTITVTPVGGHAFGIILATWDAHKTNTTAAQFVGKLYIDGVVVSGNLPSCWDGTSTTFIDRQSLTFMWPVQLGAGPHTLKLRAIRNSGTGTLNCEQGGSAITVLLFDVP